MLKVTSTLLTATIALSATLHPISLSVSPRATEGLQTQPVQVLQAPNWTPQQQHFVIPAKPASGDPTLMQYASELGLKLPDGMKLVYAPSLPAADDLDAASTAGVYYNSTNTIFIKTGYNRLDTKNLLAYEFMHYVWEKVATPAQQNMVNLEGDQLIQSDFYFKRDMQPFLGTNIQPAEQNDERDSNICTRVPESHLSAAVNAYCDQYVPNRSQIDD